MNARFFRHDLADALASSVAAAPYVAVDTEFHVEGTWLPDLYLVQLHVPSPDGTEGESWILDPLADGVLAAAGEIVSRAPAWLVHAGYQDIRLLFDAWGRVPPVIHDTQIGAGLVGAHYPAGLAALVHRFLGEPLDKAATLSDWSQRPLTPAQLAYAVDDVALLPRLWAAIEAEIGRLGRHALVNAAATEARAQALDGPREDEALEDVVVSSLSPREVGVLRALGAWRLEAARRRNKPPRYILADAVLKHLARQQPTTVETLEANRKLPRQVLKRDGAALLDTIAAALELPDDRLPPVISPGSAAERRLEFLGVLAATLGRTHAFAPRLGLPASLRARLAVAPPTDRRGVADILGWRDALIGDVVFDALQGRVALHLDGGELVAGAC